MTDGGGRDDRIELPLRVHRVRTLVGSFAFPAVLRAWIPAPLVAAGFGAVIGLALSGGRTGATLGAVAGAGLVVSIGLLLASYRFGRSAEALGPEDRWRFTPSGLTIEAAGTTTEIPWITVSDLRATDRSTALLTAESRVVHRTEVPLPAPDRSLVTSWWRTALDGRPTDGAPTGHPVGSAPAGPPLRPPPSTMHLRATVTLDEWGRLAPESVRSQRIALGLAVAVLLVLGGGSILSRHGSTVTGLVGMAFVVLLAAVLLLVGTRTSLLTRSRQRTRARAIHRHATGTWGEGPTVWILDPVGVEQIGSSGRRARLAWSQLDAVDVDDLVVLTRFAGGRGRIVIPRRAFVDDQLDLLLTWAEAAAPNG